MRRPDPEELIADARVQGRAQIEIEGQGTGRCIDDGVVREYADAMLESGPDHLPFPPIVVFYDGDKYWLADGFHRWEAALKVCGTPYAEKIGMDIKKGTVRDAQVYACGANHTHGLRRTNADKQNAVDFLLQDEEWGPMSNRAIANHAHVSEKMVRLRRSLRGRMDRKNANRRKNSEGHGGKSGAEVPHLPQVHKPQGVVKGQDGKTYPVRTPAPPDDEPGPPVDREGQPILEAKVQAVFERTDLADDMGILQAMRSRLTKAADDPLYTHANVGAIRKALKDAYDMLKAARPHTVCPLGLPQRWLDVGWLTKGRYDRLPEEQRHG